jgi:hypothetical protein
LSQLLQLQLLQVLLLLLLVFLSTLQALLQVEGPTLSKLFYWDSHHSHHPPLHKESQRLGARWLDAAKRLLKAAGGHALPVALQFHLMMKRAYTKLTQQPQLKQPIQNTKTFLQQVLLSWIGEDAVVQINLAAVVRTKKNERGDQHCTTTAPTTARSRPLLLSDVCKYNRAKLLIRPGRRGIHIIKDPNQEG